MNNEEWQEALDFLSGMIDRWSKHLRYYGPQSVFEIMVNGMPIAMDKRGLTQRLAVQLLQLIRLPYIALTVDKYTPEEWREFLTETLPERARERQSEKDKA